MSAVITNKHVIEISIHTEDGEKFAAWLNAHGHKAYVGATTANYIDGAWTGRDEEADRIIRALWDAFCDA